MMRPSDLAAATAYDRLLATSPKRGCYWFCRQHRHPGKAHDFSGPFEDPPSAWAAARRHAAKVEGGHDLRCFEVWP